MKSNATDCSQCVITKPSSHYLRKWQHHKKWADLTFDRFNCCVRWLCFFLQYLKATRHVASHQCLGQPHFRDGRHNPPFWGSFSPLLTGFPSLPSIFLTSYFSLSENGRQVQLGGLRSIVSFPGEVKGRVHKSTCQKSILVYFEPMKCNVTTILVAFLWESKCPPECFWSKRGISSDYIVMGPNDTPRAHIMCTYGIARHEFGGQLHDWTQFKHMTFSHSKLFNALKCSGIRWLHL